SAGWYNTAAFHEAAEEAGLYAHTFNGDAFTDEMKQQVVEHIKTHVGKVDLVIYSLAAPKRADPETGKLYNSVLKPIGKPYTTRNLNTDTGKISEITVQPATEEEITATVKVMGGEDWERWIG